MKSFIIVCSCWIGLAIASCSSTPRPAALVKADQALADKEAVAKASKAAKQIVTESQELHRRAVEAYEDGELEESARLAELASMTFDTAIEKWRIDEATKRLEDAQARTATARAIEEDETKRAQDLKRQVERMEKLFALQATQAKSEAEKKKLAEQMKAAEELEKQQREVQNVISVAASKIQVAEALEAEKAEPTKMTEARKALEASKKAFDEKKLDAARTQATAADAAATQAAELARQKFAEKQKEMDTLAERKTLFEAAGGVGASSVHQDERGVVITLHDMFAPGKNDVLEHRAPIIDRISELANKYPSFPIVVEGYTDSQGRPNDNVSLSGNRAEAVVARMVSFGKIDFNRIKSAGYGESKPIADNSNRDGRAKNRRVEVVFLFR